jgi:hypothetical protein
MDPERVRAYLQVACAGLGFDIGEVWWTANENGSSTVAAIGKAEQAVRIHFSFVTASYYEDGSVTQKKLFPTHVNHFDWIYICLERGGPLMVPHLRPDHDLSHLSSTVFRRTSGRRR